MARQVIVRYKVAPAMVARNEELVRAVFEELHEADPPGFSYATLKLDDGVTFVHVVRSDDDGTPLTELAAFRRFLDGIAERCTEQPVTNEWEQIGAFRMFGARDASLR
jgi:hypothetical protein